MMSVGHMRVLRRLLVIAGFEMLGRFAMVTSGSLVMLCRLPVMMRCFFGHKFFLLSVEGSLAHFRQCGECRRYESPGVVNKQHWGQMFEM